MPRCPFTDPEFDIEIDEPCPVCGILGYDWISIDNICVGDVIDTTDELHQILGEAIKTYSSSIGIQK